MTANLGHHQVKNVQGRLDQILGKQDSKVNDALRCLFLTRLDDSPEFFQANLIEISIIIGICYGSYLWFSLLHW
jgi:hypothetical protein